jgi:hypothetical protein
MPVAVGGHWDNEGILRRTSRDTWRFITSAKAVPLWAITASAASDFSAATFPAPKSFWAMNHLVPTLSSLAIPVVVSVLSFVFLWLVNPYKQRNDARQVRDSLELQIRPTKPPERDEAERLFQVFILAGTALADAIPDEMSPLECHLKIAEIRPWVILVLNTMGSISGALSAKIIPNDLYNKELSADEIRAWIQGVVGRLRAEIEIVKTK